MNFAESQKYLFSLGNEVLAMKLGLENISLLLESLGNPHLKYKKFRSPEQTARVQQSPFSNRFVSAPELKSVQQFRPTSFQSLKGENKWTRHLTGRFRRIATKVRITSEELVTQNKLRAVPTYFEQVTAIALQAFAEAEIELAILETGLGGRFDATTAVNAEIAAITQIALDHQHILGTTLTQITEEKAAIIRKDSKVVIGKQKDEVLNVILDQCRKVKVTPVMNCFPFEENDDEIFYQTPNASYLAQLSLEGKHQRDNACVAISLAEILVRDFGFNISNSDIERGLSQARHKGRLEWSRINGTNILFDGAHNTAGAQSLREYLQNYESPITMVFGAMKDKNIAEIAEILFPLAETLILTKSDNPRSMEISVLKEYAQNIIGG